MAVGAETTKAVLKKFYVKDPTEGHKKVKNFSKTRFLVQAPTDIY